MINILIHRNNGDPVFIALSDEMTFNVIYQGFTKSSHNYIRSAIEYASNKFLGQDANDTNGWLAADTEQSFP